MNWIKIDPENLPKGEVLAVSFDKENNLYKQKFLGVLFDSHDSHVGITCAKGARSIFNCTHYIDINKFDIPEAEPDKPVGMVGYNIHNDALQEIKRLRGIISDMIGVGQSAFKHSK